MEAYAQLTQTEWIVVLIGTISALFALYFLLVTLPARKRRRPTLKIEPKRAGDGTASTPTATTAESSWWKALAKTRERFFAAGSVGRIETLREALEEACLISDLGVGNTEEALAALRWDEINALPESRRLESAKLQLADVIRPWLRASDSQTTAADFLARTDGATTPTVVWFVGVNGVGKTTSIAKFAHELKSQGRTVMLAAGDTFRAAASEQLEIWADRLQIPCVRGQDGADSSAVLFDAIQSATAKNIEFVLCDSAGRLHNQNQLMEALAKNRRVMAKALVGAPHEILLVLDANTGQNMLSQAETFVSTVGVTGLVLTKLDGTARGGAVVAVARKTQLPIRRLGLGEKPEDFMAFDAERFASALLGVAESSAMMPTAKANELAQV